MADRSRAGSLHHALLEGADDDFHIGAAVESAGENTGSLNVRPFSLDAVRALVLLNVQVCETFASPVKGCVGPSWGAGWRGGRGAWDGPHRCT